jgi:hypothetical protein
MLWSLSYAPVRQTERSPRADLAYLVASLHARGRWRARAMHCHQRSLLGRKASELGRIPRPIEIGLDERLKAGGGHLFDGCEFHAELP